MINTNVLSFMHGHGKVIVRVAGRKILVMETSDGFAVNAESGVCSKALEIGVRVIAEIALTRKRAHELKRAKANTKNLALF